MKGLKYKLVIEPPAPPDPAVVDPLPASKSKDWPTSQVSPAFATGLVIEPPAAPRGLSPAETVLAAEASPALTDTSETPAASGSRF